MNAWERILGLAGFLLDFTSTDFSHPTYHWLSLLVATKPETSVVDPQDEFVILQAADRSQNSQRLADGLNASLNKRAACTSIILDENISQLKGKNCVVLVECDRSFLSPITESKFTVLKGLVTGASSILWVSNTDEPTGAMITGLARSVRNEAPQVRFRTLEINRKSLDSVNSLVSIISDLAIRVTNDNEFRIVNGFVETPRYLEDELGNKSIEWIANDEEVNLIPLEQVAVPQKLGIRSPGLLDSLYFEKDTEAETDLDADEVEIEVKATGLK